MACLLYLKRHSAIVFITVSSENSYIPGFTKAEGAGSRTRGQIAKVTALKFHADCLTSLLFPRACKGPLLLTDKSPVTREVSADPYARRHDLISSQLRIRGGPQPFNRILRDPGASQSSRRLFRLFQDLCHNAELWIRNLGCVGNREQRTGLVYPPYSNCGKV